MSALLEHAFNKAAGRTLPVGSLHIIQKPFIELQEAIRGCPSHDSHPVIEHLVSAPLVPLLVKCVRQAAAAVSDPAAAWSQPFPASTAAFAVEPPKIFCER